VHDFFRNGIRCVIETLSWLWKQIDITLKGCDHVDRLVVFWMHWVDGLKIVHDFSEMVLRDQLKFVWTWSITTLIVQQEPEHGVFSARLGDCQNRSNFNSFERKLIPTQSRILVSNARLLASSKTVIWFARLGYVVESRLAIDLQQTQHWGMVGSFSMSNLDFEAGDERSPPVPG